MIFTRANVLALSAMSLWVSLATLGVALQHIPPFLLTGVALLIAALSAEGKSVIQNIEQIDRGYSNIDTRLNAIGAKIERI